MHLSDLAYLAADAPPAETGSLSDLIIRLLVAAGATGVLATILGAWFSRRKKTAADARASQASGDGAWANAAATLTGSALSLIEPYRAQIERQEQQIDRQAQQLGRQDHSLEEARRQIDSLALRIDRLEADRERSQQRETELTDQLADTRSELTELRTWAQAAWALIAKAGLEMHEPPARRPPRQRPPAD